MINNKLLDAYIKESGLSVNDVANSLNISESDFIDKKDNIKDFNVSEIFILCDVLHIVKEQEKVFFA